MAVKDSYKVPTSLDAKWFDAEISLQSQDGFGLKPTPIKVFVFVFVGFLFNYWLVMYTFLSDGTFLEKIALFLVGMALTFYLSMFDKTRRMFVQLLAPAFNYLFGKFRTIETRRVDKGNGFLNLLGIKVDENGNFMISQDGEVVFSNGDYGQFYRIVGNASILIFESDEHNILDRADLFYRKMDTNVEYLFISTKEAQKADSQIEYTKKLHQRYLDEGRYDKDLELLFEERLGILQGFEHETFNTVHQYMLVVAPNKERLRMATQTVELEYAQSSLFIRYLARLDKTHVLDLLRMIFSVKN